MDVDLLYGRDGLTISLPDGAEATVVRKPDMPVLEDPAAAVADAFDRPFGTEPLSTLARGCNSATILICDITRPVPNGLFLRPLLERLVNAGVPKEGIVIPYPQQVVRLHPASVTAEDELGREGKGR